MSLSRRSCLSALVYGGLSIAIAPPASAETPASAARFVLQNRPAPGRREPPVITCVAIQPEGDLVAVGGDDHLLRVWNFRTGKLQYELAGHRDWIRAALFVPGRDEIITAGSDRRLLRWTLAAGGAAHREVAVHDQAIASLAISADGRRLAATGFEPQMCLYDLQTGERTTRLACPCRDMRTVTFSPSGDMLAAAGRNGRLRMWAVDDFQHVRDIAAHKRRVWSLAFSPDGRHLASASEDRTTRIWNVTTGEEETVLPTGTAKILSAVYLDDQRLATGGSDNVIRIWQLNTEEQLGALEGHTGSVGALVYENDTLISGSFDTTVRVWQPLAPASGADLRFSDRETLK